MEQVCFTTLFPFDHVQRALDILRRMHFGLGAVSVEHFDGRYLVAIRFAQKGHLPAAVFIDRLAQLEGLTMVDNQQSASVGLPPGGRGSERHGAVSGSACH